MLNIVIDSQIKLMIAGVVKNHPEVCAAGRQYKDPQGAPVYTEQHYAEMDTPKWRLEVFAAKAYLLTVPRRAKINKNCDTTYFWKHRAERWTRANMGVPYISNGALLMAALLSGDIPIEPYGKRNSPNAFLGLRGE